jgi:hypothetical protein
MDNQDRLALASLVFVAGAAAPVLNKSRLRLHHDMGHPNSGTRTYCFPTAGPPHTGGSLMLGLNRPSQIGHLSLYTNKACQASLRLHVGNLSPMIWTPETSRYDCR